jgi:hypothetical protein
MELPLPAGIPGFTPRSGIPSLFRANVRRNSAIPHILPGFAGNIAPQVGIRLKDGILAWSTDSAALFEAAAKWAEWMEFEIVL